jgi:aldehyde dehydrogenase (NAD+)
LELEAIGFDKPTIFSEVRTDIRIAQEEIFGPVLCILPRETVEEAVAIANDTAYGLGAGMCRAGTWTPSRTSPRGSAPARCISTTWPGIRTRRSAASNSRGTEYGVEGMREYLEVKSILGYF